MSGSILFKNAPDQIKVQCYDCKLQHTFQKADLKAKGVGGDATMPDLLKGLARLLKCDRARDQSRDLAKACGIRYVDLSG